MKNKLMPFYDRIISFDFYIYTMSDGMGRENSRICLHMQLIAILS